MLENEGQKAYLFSREGGNTSESKTLIVLKLSLDRLVSPKMFNGLRKRVACIVLRNSDVFCRAEQDTKQTIACGEVPYIVLVL